MIKRVQSGKRSFKRRAISALAVGSTGLISTVAIASVAATGVVLSLTATSDARSGILRWIEPVVSVLTVSTITTAGPVAPTTVSVRGVAPPVLPAGGPIPAAGSSGMELGINVSALSYWLGDRSFMNLAIGGGRQLISAAGAYVGAPPADRLDANYDVVLLNAGESITRPISLPTKAFRGGSVEVVCRWEGSSPSYRFFGSPAKNIKISKNSATFTWVPEGSQSVQLIYKGVDPANPFRNLDCREADADPTAIFDPTFLDSMKRYSTIRFMNWSWATNMNNAVTWKTRNKPGGGAIDAIDGVPIEYMIALANQTKANPWFTIPWNADAEYVRKMAELVRDTLDPSLKAYVEVGNEVWNYQFNVTKQAEKEGLAKGLSTNAFQAAIYRYAEKTGEVMDVWTDVFNGQTSRIVRIAATQNSTWPAGNILTFRDTAKKVDAIATAPYFANDAKVPVGGLATAALRDAYLASLAAKVDTSIANAKAVKTVAKNNNVRFISYEAGQHVLGNDFGEGHILIQRDPRMGALYTRYLTGWKKEIGDLLTLYQDVGRINSYGAWGMQEYAGQPLSEAPKANAVDLFRKSYLARK